MINIACIGAGPGGLFFATLLKQYVPDVHVTVFERNGPTETFGFGVVFSDATLRRINEADPVLRDGLRVHGRHWDTIEMRLKGARHTFSGNGMSAIHRRTLLRLLQERAVLAGVELRFASHATLAEVAAGYDIVIGSDGAHSSTRAALGDVGHVTERAATKYIWFGTTKQFAGLTNIHRRTKHGNIAVVAYPISDELSTFVAECDEDTWRRAGLDGFDGSLPYGHSDEVAQRYLEEVFAEDLEGHHLVTNNSRWANFITRGTRDWYRGSVALLGDALHTAHFSVGSGTKMAMEDALVLAQELAKTIDDPEAAFARYEVERKPEIARTQNAARPSLGWWERFTRYYDAFSPLQFTFHYFTRYLTLEKVRQRDPRLAASVEDEWTRAHGAHALDTPLSTGNIVFPSRYLQLRQLPRPQLTDPACGIAVPLGPPDGGAVPLVAAPDDESGLSAAVDALPSGGAVAIAEGTSWTRSLIAEEARLRRGLVTILVEETGTDRDRAATLVLSGRADAVAVPADSWGSDV